MKMSARLAMLYSLKRNALRYALAVACVVTLVAVFTVPAAEAASKAARTFDAADIPPVRIPS